MEGRKDTKIFSRLFRVLLGALAHLPLPLLHAVGAFLGWSIYLLSPGYRKHLKDNLAQAGITDASVRRDAIAHAGKMLLELPALWFRSHEQVAALVREVQGAEPAYAARDAGKPIVFLTPHMGSFEVTAQYAARHTPITVLYRPPKIGALEPLMQEGRSRPNMRLAPADVTGVRELFAAIRRGEAVGFLPDQVPSEGEGEWAEFFGRPAYTMTLAAKLAQRAGITVALVTSRKSAAVERRARELGITPAYVPFNGVAELDEGLRGVRGARADALLVFPDGATVANRTKLAEFAIAQRMPSMFGWSEYVDAGGLMSYGANVRAAYVDLGGYADRLLRGARPGELPIVQPARFELVLNQRTARLLQLALPQALTLQAARLVE